MPIYDYKCRACGHTFEALLLPKFGTKPVCPGCQGEDAEQLISGFAVKSTERSQTAFNAARKQAEKSIREQKIAEAEGDDHH